MHKLAVIVTADHDSLVPLEMRFPKWHQDKNCSLLLAAHTSEEFGDRYEGWQVQCEVCRFRPIAMTY